MIVTIVISIFTAITELFIEGKPTVVFYSYAFVVPLVVLLPQVFLSVNRRLRERVNNTWLLWFNRIVFGVVAINIPGSIYLHDIGSQYDRFVHFGSAFGSFFLFVLLFFAFCPSSVNILMRKVHILAISFFVLFLGLFIWEGFQIAIDQLFGTRLFFDIGQSIQVDFWEDISFGFLGLVTALFYANYSFKNFSRIFCRSV